jgi:hypothetical protein
MSQKPGKSPEMLRREAKISELQTILKKKQSTLKRLKTRLQNMKAEIEDLQHKFHGQILHRMEQIDRLRQEIAELAGRLKKVKWLNRDEKETLRSVADEFGTGSFFGEEFDQYQERKARMETGDFDFEEEDRARLQDLFQHFQEPPSEAEQRDIRKVFIKLSNKFHPDKATNEKQAAAFHNLMQDINKAYQEHDIQALLEMERLYLLEDLDFEHKSLTVDALQQEIERLKKELSFIENQIDRTSGEIKNLRQSELGEMLTTVNRAEREGGGLDEATAAQEHVVDMLTRVRDGMEESLRMGALSPTLDEALEEMMYDFLSPDELNFTDADVLDMLMDFMDEEVENPNFPVGSSVRVTHPLRSPILAKAKMKNWEGRVQGVYYDENDRIVYEVSFDSLTINQMPAELIERAVREWEDFQTCDIPEYALAAAQPRDSEDDAFGAYRKRQHALSWANLPRKQKQRLQDILLRYPHLSDDENWDAYLKENLSLPFEAEIRDIPGMPEGAVVEVVSIYPDFFDDEAGHIVKIRIPGRKGRAEQPLFSLRSKERTGKNYQILEDYYAWAEEWLLL